MNDDIDKEVNEEGLLSQIKYKKFGCIEKLDEGFNTLSNDFLELDYTEISILLILIARSLAKRVEYWSMYHLSQLDNSEIHRIFNDSLTVFKDWPNNYIIYLKGIQTSSKIIRHKGKNTVKHDIVMSLSEFGKFYKKLYDTIFDAPCFKFVRDAFENFLVKEWKHGSLKQFRKIDLTKYERIMMTPKRAPLSAI